MTVLTNTAPVAKPEHSTPLEYVSASRLQTFHQCRLKFYFRYVLKLHKPKSAALHVGSVVHEALQSWNRARWKRQPVTLDALREEFAKHWTEDQEQTPVQWAEDEPEGKELEAAWNLVRMYLQQTPIPLHEPIDAVEVSVEADLSNHGLPKLVGILDLVRGGGRIVDYKTSGQTPNSERAVHLHELQLSCYALLYRDATGRKECGFELHHLVKLKTPKLVVTSAGPMTPAQEDCQTKNLHYGGIGKRNRPDSPLPTSSYTCFRSGSAMRILIQDCTSQLFLTADNQWTSDATLALAFRDTVTALHACRQRPGLNLQIVLKFTHPGASDVNLPVMGSDC